MKEKVHSNENRFQNLLINSMWLLADWEAETYRIVAEQ